MKMSGSGNDFVVLDNRSEYAIEDARKPAFVRDVCRRRIGVGADGVLFVEDSETSDFRMRYFNADGGEAEFCGNGARCIAHYAHHELGFSAGVIFDSKSGFISAEVRGDEVEVLMPPAGDVLGPKPIEIGGRRMEYYFVNTGVPHVVVLCNDLVHAPVLELGRLIRNHDAFKPVGTNVDFSVLCPTDDADIEIRTYERGVEGETLACGTGVEAVAIVAVHRGDAQFPVRVKVALPDILLVDKPGKRHTLTGDVRRVFKGSFDFEVGPD